MSQIEMERLRPEQKNEQKSNSLIAYVPLTLLVIFCAGICLHASNADSFNNLSITLTIAASNDIHGAYYPSVLKVPSTGQRYEYGGLQIMSKLIEILRQKSDGYFLYFDVGDQFQGSLQSGKYVSQGEIMADFYNHAKFDATVFGNHEFDYGPQFLNNYLSKLSNPILTSNLVDLFYNQTDKNYLPLRNQQKSHLFTFPINISSFPKNKNYPKQLKIGVVGITTQQTVLRKFPSTYEFLSYKESILKQTQKLKQNGADAIILLSHAGNQCGKNTTFGIWTQKQHLKQYQKCVKNQEIFNLIDQLPQGTIDAVIQGHRHSISHIYYKGIPIIGPHL